MIFKRCGHCKRLKPEYAKAAELLKGNEPEIAMVKVDCTEGGKDTCSKYSVTGYPTLKIFRNGEVSRDYSGPREAGMPFIHIIYYILQVMLLKLVTLFCELSMLNFEKASTKYKFIFDLYINFSQQKHFCKKMLIRLFYKMQRFT